MFPDPEKSISCEYNALIAVIVVNYNAGSMLLRCLETIRSQTIRPKQVIVVDNASQDGSILAAETRFPEFDFIKLEKNIGFAAANNLAIHRTDGCYWIALLNPDAFAAPDWLERMLHASVSYPEYHFFGARMLMDDDHTKLDGVGDIYHAVGLPWRMGHGKTAAGQFVNPMEIFSPCAAAALYRRDDLIMIGGFDEDFFCYVEDVDVGFRLRLMGLRCLYVPDAIVFHKGSALTGRRSNFAVYHGQRNLIWTFLKNVPAPWVWLLSPFHLLLNFVAVPLLGLPALRAKRDALIGLGNIWRKRHVIQRTRCIGFRNLVPVMKFSLSSLMCRD